MNDERIKGRARLLLDHQIVECAPVKIETPKFGQISWNLMEVQGLFDMFKSFLLLPEQYEIVGVYFDIAKMLWTLILESEDIPLPKETYTDLPLLMPVYWIDEDGKVGISELKFL